MLVMMIILITTRTTVQRPFIEDSLCELVSEKNTVAHLFLPLWLLSLVINYFPPFSMIHSILLVQLLSPTVFFLQPPKFLLVSLGPPFHNPYSFRPFILFFSQQVSMPFQPILLQHFNYGRPMEQGRPLYFCPVVTIFFFPRLISAARD